MALESKQTSKAHRLVTGACSALLRQNGKGLGNTDDVLQEACLRVLELKEPQAIREPDRYIGRIAKICLLTDSENGSVQKRFSSTLQTLLKYRMSSPAQSVFWPGRNF
jgi:DNA-directed RNA polymerase specialized sigma24 family protein